MPRLAEIAPRETALRRRADADHQPHVAWEMQRVVTVARRAQRVLTEVTEVAVDDLIAEIAEALVAHTIGAPPASSVRDLVVAELCAAVERHAAKVSRSRRADAPRQGARSVVALVHSGTLAQKLTTSWEKVREPQVALEAVVTRITREGIDAEALCWAIIGYEAQHHIGLIWHEAHKLCRRIPDCTPEDLFGWGWLGMRVAMRNFDPARGFRFATYACQRVSGAMRDGVRSEHPLPKRLTTLQRKLSRAEDELSAELGRTPTLAEVAERIGERLEVLEIAPRLQAAASIEEIQSASERSGEGWLLADDTDPADEALAVMRRDAVRAAMDSLDDDEAEAVRLLYWQGLSVPEARELTGATARQLRARATRGREALAEILADWR